MVQSFKELLVWQRSFDLANLLMSLSASFPKEHRYGLTAQLLRCAVSVPSNIAEGYNRKSTKEYINFLSIAYGSLAELETQILIAIEQSFMNDMQSKELLDEIDQISRMLRSMMQKLTEKQAA